MYVIWMAYRIIKSYEKGHISISMLFQCGYPKYNGEVKREKKSEQEITKHHFV